jgi:hypothetical protein
MQSVQKYWGNGNNKAEILMERVKKTYARTKTV